MQNWLTQVLVGHLQIYTVAIYLTGSQYTVYLLSVEKCYVFKSQDDVVQLMSDQSIYYAGKDVLFLDGYAFFDVVLLTPFLNIRLNLF
jgi:hypothetical protein